MPRVFHFAAKTPPLPCVSTATASATNTAARPRYSNEVGKPRHPLGQWTAEPAHRTIGEMWESRWRAEQPHPSFDVGE